MFYLIQLSYCTPWCLKTVLFVEHIIQLLLYNSYIGPVLYKKHMREDFETDCCLNTVKYIIMRKRGPTWYMMTGYQSCLSLNICYSQDNSNKPCSSVLHELHHKTCTTRIPLFYELRYPSFVRFKWFREIFSNQSFYSF